MTCILYKYIAKITKPVEINLIDIIKLIFLKESLKNYILDSIMLCRISGEYNMITIVVYLVQLMTLMEGNNIILEIY